MRNGYTPNYETRSTQPPQLPSISYATSSSPQQNQPSYSGSTPGGGDYGDYGPQIPSNPYVIPSQQTGQSGFTSRGVDYGAQTPSNQSTSSQPTGNGNFATQRLRSFSNPYVVQPSPSPQQPTANPYVPSPPPHQNDNYEVERPQPPQLPSDLYGVRPSPSPGESHQDRGRDDHIRGGDTRSPDDLPPVYQD